MILCRFQSPLNPEHEFRMAPPDNRRSIECEQRHRNKPWTSGSKNERRMTSDSRRTGREGFPMSSQLLLCCLQAPLWHVVIARDPDFRQKRKENVPRDPERTREVRERIKLRKTSTPTFCGSLAYPKAHTRNTS